MVRFKETYAFHGILVRVGELGAEFVKCDFYYSFLPSCENVGERHLILEVPTPVLLPGESHGWRSLVGCSPWGRQESDTTERLHFHVSLSCIGEGNGNSLQGSCLENPGKGEPGGLPSMGWHRVGHD